VNLAMSAALTEGIGKSEKRHRTPDQILGPYAPHFAPFIRHPSTGEQHRRARDPGVARAFQAGLCPVPDYFPSRYDPVYNQLHRADKRDIVHMVTVL
jgi:hypothetical protein